ncbi:MAG: ABC transporter permease [Cyclobacteriaceae bacterium]
MLVNYLKIAWRNFAKSKTISFINIFGLFISITSSLLIFQYVHQELSYDSFFKNKDRIYRLQEDRFKEGEIIGQWAAALGAAGPFIYANLPEVERYTQLLRADWGNLPISFSYNDIMFREPKAYFASTDFFKVFSIKLLEGTDSLALARPNTVVLSESVAHKYFGSENPIGKTLRMDNSEDFEVTGVFEDLPSNTHMNADVLLSLETMINWWGGDPTKLLNWKDEGYHTYLLMTPHVNLAAFQEKMKTLVWEEDKDTFTQYNERVVFNLQKITDIHLDSHYTLEYTQNGDRKAVYFLFVIAVFILIIGWINYINLYTSKSLERAKEVGLRKVMGGLRHQIIAQFLAESGLLNLMAVVLSAGALVLFYFNPDIPIGMKFELSIFRSPSFWLIFIILFIVSVFISGIYPAFVLSSYSAVATLKGKFARSTRGLIIRKSLLIFQFVATLILLISTLTVYEQINYMRQQDLGLSIAHTLVVRAPNVRDTLYNIYQPAFKNKLLQHSFIKRVGTTSDIPGQTPSITTGSARRLDQSDKEVGYYYVNFVDEDYLQTMDLTFLAGRDFQQNTLQQWNDIIINQTAMKKLGFESPERAAGDQITFWRDTFNIIGVVKDFHVESLKQEVKPLIFRFAPFYRGYFTIQLEGGNIKEAIAEAENTWKEFFSAYPFEYFFLDQHFNNQYKSDQRFGNIVTIFSILAIVIACLGLFGLSSLAVTYRMKEIGIRKVLGATVTHITLLLNSDFLKLIVIAIIVSIPLAYWVMTQWLNGFAYRIEMGWWLFILPGSIVILIALITVLAKSIQAALTNPVNTLRSE